MNEYYNFDIDGKHFVTRFTKDEIKTIKKFLKRVERFIPEEKKVEIKIDLLDDMETPLE